MRVNELICKAWLKLSAEDKSCADQWISDETWRRVIRKCHIYLSDAIQLNCGALNLALPSLSTRRFGSSNLNGIYHKNSQKACPYAGKKRRVSFYYRSVHRQPPSDPSAATNIEDVFAKSIRMYSNRLRIEAFETEKRKQDEVGKEIQKTTYDAQKN